MFSLLLLAPASTSAALLIAEFEGVTNNTSIYSSSNSACVTNQASCTASCTSTGCEEGSFGKFKGTYSVGCVCQKCGVHQNETRPWSGGLCCVSNGDQCTARTSEAYPTACPISAWISGSFGASCQCCDSTAFPAPACAGGGYLVFQLPVCPQPTKPPTPAPPPTPPTKPPTPAPTTPPTPIQSCPMSSSSDCCKKGGFCSQFPGSGNSYSCSGASSNGAVTCTCNGIVRCQSQGKAGSAISAGAGAGIAFVVLGIGGVAALYHRKKIARVVNGDKDTALLKATVIGESPA
jgi:hypothetical protein